MKELTITEQAPVEKGTQCDGLTFVVTGDVHHYKNRNELKAYIESQGGKVTGSVSKSTNYLINNDAASQIQRTRRHTNSTSLSSRKMSSLRNSDKKKSLRLPQA